VMRGDGQRALEDLERRLLASDAARQAAEEQARAGLERERTLVAGQAEALGRVTGLEALAAERMRALEVQGQALKVAQDVGAAQLERISALEAMRGDGQRALEDLERRLLASDAARQAAEGQVRAGLERERTLVAGQAEALGRVTGLEALAEKRMGTADVEELSREVSADRSESFEELRNSGVFVRGLHSNGKGTQGATIVVAGLGRSGTSMVAGVLRALGVFMGSQISEGVLEDREIAKILDKDDWDGFRNIAEDRNRNYLHWGFKRPNAYGKASNAIGFLRNPRMILTMRDCVAVGVRNSISVHTDPFESVVTAAKGAAHLIESAKSLKCPIMFLSYEKALFEPAQFVHGLAEYCGLSPSDNQRKSALDVIRNGSAAYLAVTTVEYDGAFSVADDGVIDAWVMTNKEFPNVEIFDGATVLGEARVVEKISRPPDAIKVPVSDPLKIRYASYRGRIEPIFVSSSLALRVKGTIFQLRRSIVQLRLLT